MIASCLNGVLGPVAVLPATNRSRGKGSNSSGGRDSHSLRYTNLVCRYQGLLHFIGRYNNSAVKVAEDADLILRDYDSVLTNT